MLSLCLQVLFVCTVLSQSSRISLESQPSNNPKNGSTLNLTCTIYENSKYKITWLKDNLRVGEDCLLFNSSIARKNCTQKFKSFEWIIDPVTYDTRGVWACEHGKERASIRITVDGESYFVYKYLPHGLF